MIPAASIPSFVFIINPFSGTTSKHKIVAQINAIFPANLYDIHIKFTEYRGHATELCSKYKPYKPAAIVAIGGDGTINEVASQLISSGIPLGIISMGSGNGFARHMQLHQSISKSLHTIKNLKTVLIDTATIDNKPFINVAGIGFDAKIAYKTKKTKLRGLWQYVYTTIKYSTSLNSIKATITMGEDTISGEYLTIAAANGSLYGFNFAIAPEASVKDGLLDILAVRKVALWQYLIALPAFVTSQLHKCSFVHYIKVKKVCITLDSNTTKHYYHVDGEGCKSKANSHEITILPQSLLILC